MKVNTFLIIVLNLITFSVHAAQDRGGGNTINGKLIEEYLVNPYIALPDFEKDMDIFIGKFNNLPEVVSKFRSTIDDKNWYIVPVRLKELPFLETGLNFPSDQLAYQNSSEIFFDEALLNTISPSSRTLFYKHELLMATFGLSSEETRNLMVYFIKNPNFDIIKFRTMFRMSYMNDIYFTKVELEVLDSIAATVTEDIRDICRSTINDGEKVNTIANIYKLLLNEAHDTKLWYKDSENKVDIVLKDEKLGNDTQLYKFMLQARVKDSLGSGLRPSARKPSDIIDQCNNMY